jgi:aspartate aminotransferase
MGLLAKRAGLIDTENTFRIGPQIRAIEEEGKKVIKCNLGEPDFPVPDFIKEEHPQFRDGRKKAHLAPCLLGAN